MSPPCKAQTIPWESSISRIPNRVSLGNESLVYMEMDLWLATMIMDQAVVIKQEPIALSKNRGETWGIMGERGGG